jgi:hypothetical protein
VKLLPIASAFLLFVLQASCKGSGFSDGERAKGSGNSSVDEENANEPGADGSAAEGEADSDLNVTDHEFLKTFPSGADQMKVLCARPGQDKVRTVFCSPTPPVVTSLVELQSALGLAFTDPTLLGRRNNGQGGNPGFVLTGHSSSLVARFTNAINPRAIFFSPGQGGTPDFVAMGFLRGEQFAEIIARDPSTNQLAFFLVNFEQACNSQQGGCSVGELLTPAIESNWTKLSIYEDVDLENTIADCTQCHQPGGPNSQKMLRMQELQDPWTHFFRDNRLEGSTLMDDYFAAHGTQEDYAGIPAALINASDPARLEDFVRGAGFANQPNEMDTQNTSDEVVASNANQPLDNSTPGQSATWQAQYEATVRGEFIAMPYHDVKVTDPAKLATMTQAYQGFVAGQTAAKDLPDIRDAFLDAGLPDMGFKVKAGLNGREILVNACRVCHNSQLNQNISRAKFNIDTLDTLSREEKDKAIQRLMLPEDHLLKMPPRRFKSLTDAERGLAIGELKK